MVRTQKLLTSVRRTRCRCDGEARGAKSARGASIRIAAHTLLSSRPSPARPHTSLSPFPPGGISPSASASRRFSPHRPSATPKSTTGVWRCVAGPLVAVQHWCASRVCVYVCVCVCVCVCVQPPKPPTPYTRRKKRTTAPSGSARRLRVLKPGSVGRGAHSLQPGTCSESSLRQCSHAHSGNRTGAFTARARRFNRWGSTHHSHKKHRARIPTQRHPTMCATRQQRNASDSLTMTDPLESVCV